VLSETSDKALTVSACHYKGPEPGEEDNLVITGHDYTSGAIFGNLSKITVDDAVMLTDKNGKPYSYSVYKIDHINPDDANLLDNGAHSRELSLLTCENNGNGKLLVRCVPEDE
jgi:LPXTG-site transpeptidase (sortase) family protein